MRTPRRILPTIVYALWVILSRTAVALPEEVASSGKGGAQHLAPGEVPKGVAASDWQSIRAAYEAGRHAFQPIEGGWQARNPGQQWTTKFDGRGFVAEKYWDDFNRLSKPSKKPCSSSGTSSIPTALSGNIRWTTSRSGRCNDLVRASKNSAILALTLDSFQPSHAKHSHERI